MSSDTLAGLHRAAVHFPIALVLCSGALDGGALLAPAGALVMAVGSSGGKLLLRG